MYRQRNFLAMVTLAATAATTLAWGQTAGPAAVAANGGAQSAGPIPDFSGIWAHASLPGFEPPSSGPGPVTNRLRLRGGPQNGRSNPNQLVGDYSNPILKPEAAEAVKKHGEISLAGVAYPTPSNQCWPESVPYIFWNFGMQMLQQPHQLTILYDQDHEVRHVRMNELHPARVVPSWYGDSVGHYEGEALIIDTVGIKARRPFATVDAFGTPYTEALHVVERYRLLDYEAAKEGLERDLKENFQVVGGTFFNDPNYRGKHLQLEFTVEDAGVFTASWSATITYRRGFNSFGRDEWSEVVCSENPHEYYSGKDTAVPHADKPDF